MVTEVGNDICTSQEQTDETWIWEPKIRCKTGKRQALEYVNQFKYLGVIFKDHHRNKYLDKSETVATIDQDLKQKAFLFSKKAACPVDVIALLLHSCFMPKLLYGSEVFPIQPKILETYHAKLAKTALCTYDMQSNTKALNFIGWKSAKQQQNERTLNFFFRLIISDYHEICDIALSAFNDQKSAEMGENNPQVAQWWV